MTPGYERGKVVVQSDGVKVVRIQYLLLFIVHIMLIYDKSNNTLTHFVQGTQDILRNLGKNPQGSG